MRATKVLFGFGFFVNILIFIIEYRYCDNGTPDGIVSIIADIFGLSDW